MHLKVKKRAYRNLIVTPKPQQTASFEEMDIRGHSYIGAAVSYSRSVREHSAFAPIPGVSSLQFSLRIQPYSCNLKEYGSFLRHRMAEMLVLPQIFCAFSSPSGALFAQVSTIHHILRSYYLRHPPAHQPCFYQPCFYSSLYLAPPKAEILVI